MLMQTPTSSLDELMVIHSSAEEALNKLNRAYRRALGRNEPSGLTLTGESGSGKTTILKSFVNELPAVRTEDGVEMPVLMVTVPANPNLRELASSLIVALGADQGSMRESEAQKTRRVKTLIKNMGVRVIIFEEFQHFSGKTDKRMVIAADWLKVLLDETKIFVVLSGLPTARLALEKNEQLARRFSSQHEMPRFDWRNDKHQAEFRGILQVFKDHMEHLQFPDITFDELAFRFYLGTGGLICYIKKILLEVMWNCEDSGKKKFTLSDLATAWQDCITTAPQKAGKKFNPFSPKLKVFDASGIDSLIAFAKSIGAPNL